MSVMVGSVYLCEEKREYVMMIRRVCAEKCIRFRWRRGDSTSMIGWSTCRCVYETVMIWGATLLKLGAPLL